MWPRLLGAMDAGAAHRLSLHGNRGAEACCPRSEELEARVAELERRLASLEAASTTVTSTATVLVHTVALFATVVAAWACWGGGPTVAAPLSLYIVFLCHRRDTGASLVRTCKANFARLRAPGARIVPIFLALWCAAVVVSDVVLSKVWSSAGTPPSLVVFSVVYLVSFVLPPVLSRALRCATPAADARRGLAACGRWLRRNWGPVVGAAVALALLFACDALITALLTRFFGDRACRTLLKGDDAPYNALGSLSQRVRSTLGLARLAGPAGKGDGSAVSWLRRAGSSLLHFASGLGEVPRALPAVVTLFVMAHVAIPDRYWRLRRMFVRAVSAPVIGGIVSAVLKISFHRFRPVAYGSTTTFGGPGVRVVDHTAFSKLDLSFPCGHTTVTFATSVVLAAELTRFLRWNRPSVSEHALKLTRAAVFVLPCCIVLSRVVDCVHWPSVSHPACAQARWCSASNRPLCDRHQDAVAGALLGIAVGRYVLSQPVPSALPEGCADEADAAARELVRHPKLAAPSQKHD